MVVKPYSNRVISVLESACLLFACTMPLSAQGVSREQAVSFPKHFVYVGDKTFAPYQYLDQKGEPAGFAIAVAKEAARRLGATVDFHLGNSANIHAELADGRADLSMFASSPLGANRYDLVARVWTLPEALLFRSGRTSYPSTLDGLKGEVLALSANTTLQEMVSALPEAIRPAVEITDSQVTSMSMVISGQATAAVGNEVSLRNAAARLNFSQFELRRVISLPYGFIARKGRAAEFAALGPVVESMRADGTLDRLAEENFTLPPAREPWMERMLPFASIGGGLLVAALGWVYILRRTVAARTKSLSELLALHNVDRARLRAILDSSPLCIKLVDAAGRVIEMNPAGLAILGADSQEQVIGKPVSGMLDPEFRDEFQRAVQRSLLGEHVVLEYKARSLTGKELWLESHCTRLSLPEGEAAVLSVTSDITTRKLAEHELRWAHQHLVWAQSAAQFGLAWRRKATGQTRWSAELFRILGLPVPEASEDWMLRPAHRKQAFRLVHPEERESVRLAFAAAMSGHPFDELFRVVRPDGKTIYLHAKGGPFFDESGAIIGTTGTVADVTQREIAHLELETERKRLEAYIEGGAQGIVAIDANGRICLMNAKCEEMFGRSRSSVMGGPIEILLPGVDRCSGSSQVTGFRRDGTAFPIEISVSQIQAESGSVDGDVTLVFMTDITERKAIENERQRMTAALRDLASHLQDVREEERARIAREVHDELGQELTAMKMQVACLDHGAESLPSRIKEQLSSLGAGLETAIRSTRNIATGLRPSVLDRLGLVAALKWLATEFEKNFGIVCQARIGDAQPAPDTSTTIFRVAQEALTNVAKHAGASMVSIDFAYQDDALELRVWDNGNGIQPADHEKPSAFGLLGMRERAALAGGLVEVSRLETGGTLLRLVLPAKERARG